MSPQHDDPGDDRRDPSGDAHEQSVEAIVVSGWVPRDGFTESAEYAAASEHAGSGEFGDGPVVMSAGWSPFPTT